MPLTKEDQIKYTSRILFSRLRLLQKHGFYGLLLMHVKFGLDEECETAYTDGEKICFSPLFLDKLSDKELDFILMHEILHIVLFHCFRHKKDEELFNIACDIVVNSNILKSNDLDKSTITLKEFGESMHLAPNGLEGYNYTAEEVYDMLLTSGKYIDKNKSNEKEKSSKTRSGGQDKYNDSFDDHAKWDKTKLSKEQIEELGQLLVSVTKSVNEKDKIRGTTSIPLGVQRIVEELINPKLDWKVILNDFVQEEITDYSFNPPDKRYNESDFYLPDYNDTDFIIKDILFLIDTSGSISDKDLVSAYSEIKGAIDQFDGKLIGKLSFFDTGVSDPVLFSSVDDLLKIKPIGGGGTSFDVIFKYINKNLSNNPPASIIIITDGYAPFPQFSVTSNIPVLWIITNDKVTPPWGKVARL